MTSPPSSALEKRKFFLEALGVIAKQPSNRQPVIKSSQGTIPGQLGTGGTSLAPPTVSSTAKVASDLTTVYDLGKLSSSQKEGTCYTNKVIIGRGINAIKFKSKPRAYMRYIWETK